MLGRTLKTPPNRLIIMSVITIISTVVIVGKLFMLQIVNHGYYQAKASEDRQGITELEPRRGNILIKDYHSGEIFRLATNTTLDTLFVDPHLITDPKLIADLLAPLVFDLETEQKKDAIRVKEALKKAPIDIEEEELEKLMTPRSEEELQGIHYKNLLDAISQKIRDRIVLIPDPEEETITQIREVNASGIMIEEEQIVAYPAQISNQKRTAGKIAKMIDIPVKRLTEILEGKNRYVILKRKISPETSATIKKLKEDDGKKIFRGIGLEEHTYRYYPEGQLASQISGFTDNAGNGQYGLEGYFNSQLSGKKGLFRTQIDASGQQVTIGKDVLIQPAVDGDDITLTIDRSIQLAIERKLERHVTNNRADSGQVIVMEPKTGKIIAIAQFPTFNPNNYPGALDLEEVKLNDEEKERIVEVERGDTIDTFLYVNIDTHDRIQLFPEEEEDGKIVYYKYKNRIGPAAYKNMVITDPYEPGSVFKPVAMAAAIDDGDVTPSTTYYENGPIQVDEFEIGNAQDKYRGTQDMTQVLQYSSNLGMAFVAKKIGRNLLYNYMQRFGFMEKTDIEFEGEHEGRIEDFTQWAESELVTHAFGQGILTTPLQMVTAYAAIANKGVLMQPHIVEKIEEANGKVTIIEPRTVGRAITEQTADTMVAMLANAVEYGIADRAQVANYIVAGKTGTSQTYKWGKPLTGPGTTLTSFIGFAPINAPKFVVLVKMDKPRASEWGSATAAPLFAEIAEYLFQYYNIPPDK